jgi:hypothetical protein
VHITVCAAERLRDDRIYQFELQQFLSGEFQRFGRLRGLCAVVPENCGTTFG